MASQPSEADMAALELPEVFEMILMHLTAADILEARHVSTRWRDIIEASLKSMRRLFLRAEPDHDVWLLDDTGLQAESLDVLAERNLHRHFAPTATLLASASVGSEAEMHHQGPRARVVRFNPWLFHRGKRTLWQCCDLRPREKAKDRVSVLALNPFVPNAPVKFEPWSALARRLGRHHNRMSKRLVCHVLGTVGWQRRTVSQDSSPKMRRVGEEFGDIWKRMLLTQSPVRKVTVQIRFKQSWTWEGGEVLPKDEDIVKEIVVDGGVRLGHLLAALTGKEKTAIREAEEVTTSLLLHDVVEIVEPEIPKRFVRRRSQRKGKEGNLFACDR